MRIRKWLHDKFGTHYLKYTVKTNVLDMKICAFCDWMTSRYWLPNNPTKEQIEFPLKMLNQLKKVKEDDSK